MLAEGAEDLGQHDAIERRDVLDGLNGLQSHLVLVQNHAAVRESSCLRYGSTVAGKGCKRRKLRSPIMERHPRMRLRLRVRQSDDIVVISIHALCPPIWLFRSLAVAPSR